MLDTLAGLFIQYLDTIRDALESIRDQTPQTPHFSSDEFHRDLYGIATGVVANLKEYPDLVNAATNIMRTFDASIIYNNVSSAATARSCKGGEGLTIYWTKSSQRPSVDYLTTSFAQATRWDEFLNAFSLDIHLSVLKWIFKYVYKNLKSFWKLYIFFYSYVFYLNFFIEPDIIPFFFWQKPLFKL